MAFYTMYHFHCSRTVQLSEPNTIAAKINRDTLVVLLPYFDDAIPSTCKDGGWLKWMPDAAYGRSVAMRTIFLQNLVSLPFPKKDIAVAIATHEESSIGRNGWFAGITRHDVAGKLFIVHGCKALAGLKANNVIVETLSDNDGLRWMQCQARNGVHGWVGNVLNGDTNVLIIRNRK
jgi:molybdopterin-binding protein